MSPAARNLEAGHQEGRRRFTARPSPLILGALALNQGPQPNCEGLPVSFPPPTPFLLRRRELETEYPGVSRFKVPLVIQTPRVGRSPSLFLIRKH